MKTTVVVSAFAACLMSGNVLAANPSVNPTIENRYPGPWETEFNMGITQTLSKSGARGCGIIKYRESAKDDSEYLVVCSTDNETWDVYMVWPNINEVMGPYTLD